MLTKSALPVSGSIRGVAQLCGKGVRLTRTGSGFEFRRGYTHAPARYQPHVFARIAVSLYPLYTNALKVLHGTPMKSYLNDSQS